MLRSMLIVAFVLLSIAPVQSEPVSAAEVVSSPTDSSVLGRDGLRRTMLKAASESDDVNRREMFRLRVASLSPAFMEKVELLAVLELQATDYVMPLNADGTVDKAAIDWDALLAFIEKIIPLILQLIDLFGYVESGHQLIYAFNGSCYDLILAA